MSMPYRQLPATLWSDEAQPPEPTRIDAPPIDLVHLARQTFGDKDLEIELLGLFARQARTIVRAMEAPGASTMPDRAGDMLHTLCGSARAVGAWAVAESAQTLERAIRGAVQPRGTSALAGPLGLSAAVENACAVIDDLIGPANQT